MNANSEQGNDNMNHATVAPQPFSNARRVEWLRPRNIRRLLTGITLGALIAFVATAATNWIILSSLFLFVFMLGWWLLRISVRHIVELPTNKLDERMLTVRNQTFRASYMAAAGVFILLWILATVLVGYYKLDVTMGHTYGIGLGFIWLMVALPTAFYAWTESEV